MARWPFNAAIFCAASSVEMQNSSGDMLIALSVSGSGCGLGSKVSSGMASIPKVTLGPGSDADAAPGASCGSMADCSAGANSIPSVICCAVASKVA